MSRKERKLTTGGGLIRCRANRRTPDGFAFDARARFSITRDVYPVRRLDHATDNDRPVSNRERRLLAVDNLLRDGNERTVLPMGSSSRPPAPTPTATNR